MQFDEGFLYHIYNQGNNKGKVFFTRENYLFFLKKTRIHICSHADIIAWCLMPNHFHLMVLVNKNIIDVAKNSESQTGVLSSEIKQRSFNDSIGILLRSYTRAINKQENSSGALFRKETKSQCLNSPTALAPSFYSKNGTQVIVTNNPEKEYPQVCFNYIHENPVSANLVANTTDWEFSLALDYANLRNGNLVNKKVANEYVNF